MKNIHFRLLPFSIVSILLFTRHQVNGDSFRSQWSQGIERTWIGPEYFANRLQDWRLSDGRVECIEASLGRPIRVLHVLPLELNETQTDFEIEVQLGTIESAKTGTPDSWAGFLIGSGGKHVDYRLTAMVHHRPARDGGLIAAVDGSGRVMFRDNETNIHKGNSWSITGKLREGELSEIPADSREDSNSVDVLPGKIKLRLLGAAKGQDNQLTLVAQNAETGNELSRAILLVDDPSLIEGCIGLVSHLGPPESELGYWFSDFNAQGGKLTNYPERAFGPIFCTQYTLSNNILKLTAQMPPLSEEDDQEVILEIQDKDGSWRQIAQSRINDDCHTAQFRIENWNPQYDIPYRVSYDLNQGSEYATTYYWTGTIRAEPVEKEEIVVAAFTGNKHFTGNLQWNHNSIWFPHIDITEAVAYHDPDLLFFSGDQVYEGDITGAQRRPLEKAILDYHDKWYRWCWTFGDLARDRPCICIPDDHDVYHGNIWGAGGRAAQRQDDGGYTMPPRFVRMVERTQTSHLPDPYDPTPIEQDIGVYYTSIEYGGVSFAVIEDRKFKSSPTVMVPDGKVVNGWFQYADFDPTDADVAGATLLGNRQLEFLRHWGQDWSGNTWMKVVLSQTIFANVATIPRDATSGSVLPSLPIPLPDEYPSDYKLAADADSNGWPQSGRNRALQEIRRAFALHIAGDQHLGSCIQYGVDNFDDAGYAFCVPSIANTWPRRWFPPHPGEGRRKDMPRYTGRYLDGFGNHMTVHAVSNPVASNHEPAALHDRAPGYGIVRFNRADRSINIECWPRWSDPSTPGAKQYAGWPITIEQTDNYDREPIAFLPILKISGIIDPVVQIIDESLDEIVYTLRMNGTVFHPKVFTRSPHTVIVHNPDTGQMHTFNDVQPGSFNDERVIIVPF